MKFYVIGENLGNESRHIEFKAGQGSYLQKQLKDHVAKYMVAFLNSEGGTLLIGVSDGGRGNVELQRKEMFTPFFRFI